MIIFALMVSVVIALGAIAAYISCSYAESKGYMRGLEEAEQIMKEVRHETHNKARSATYF